MANASYVLREVVCSARLEISNIARNVLIRWPLWWMECVLVRLDPQSTKLESAPLAISNTANIAIMPIQISVSYALTP